MFNEIDFSKIDTGITPPQDDTERQYYYMAKLAEMVALRERELGRRITYCLQTFGCQMNALAWSSDIQRSFLSGRGTRT